MNTFGDKIRDLRKERNLTQKSVADGLSVTISTLSHWECGYQEASLDALGKIADFFEVSTDYLLGREDDFGNVTVQTHGAQLTPDERELLENYRKLNTKNRMHVASYAQIRLEEQDDDASLRRK